jgi:acyl-CoA hydrolase
MVIDAEEIEAHLPPLRPRSGPTVASAEQAVAAIPDGARVFVGGGTATPLALLQAMDDQRQRWTHLELVMPMLVQRLPVFAHAGEPFHFVSTQASPAFKYLWGNPALRVLPARFSDYSRLFAVDGPLACDVALIAVSPPEGGRVSSGLSVGSVVMPARTSPLVLGQINAEIPYTFGAGEFPVGHFDALVVADEPLRDAKSVADDDPTAAAIATLAAELIGDGSTIQFGVGSIPDAILDRLLAKRGLRVHSGLVSEACMRLHQAGVIEGTMIAAEVMNSRLMRAWVHRNPAVLMAPPSITHGAAVLAGIEQFVAINSAVEVALDGSVNSEMAAGEVISGPGGAPDFAFGASVSNGGRHLTALKSAAARGTISRIVTRIEPPHPVTLPNYLADAFITEHGRAEVRSLAGPDRAQALAAVAHPDHRPGLLRAADGA